METVNADEIIRTISADSGYSMYAISKRMGRSTLYVGGIVSRRQVPTIQTMAELCDAADFDLVARNRNTGNEFRVNPKPE